MKSNTFFQELETFIDALLAGKKVSTTLDPEVQRIIRDVYAAMKQEKPSESFRTELLETIRERIPNIQDPTAKKTFAWMETMHDFFFGSKRGLSAVLAGSFAIGLMLYLSPQWQDNTTHQELDTAESIFTTNSGSNGLLATGDRHQDAVTSDYKNFFPVGEFEFGLADDKDEAMKMPPPPSYTRTTTLSAGTREGLAMPYPEPDIWMPPFVEENRENYDDLEINPVKRVSEEPVSTFSIDVDTGSYANVRRFLKNGQLPPQDAVRVEEMINYFDYSYETPRSTETPFAVHTEIAPTPWNDKTKLLHIGIKGYEGPEEDLPPSNLVFLVDVSGSMSDSNKLSLLKQSLSLLTKTLGEDDRISLVTYAGSTATILDGASGEDGAEIEAAIARLQSGGSTHGSAGIDLAYQAAEKHFTKDGINRILLATDGDFNVGITNFDDLISIVEQKRKNGVALSTLGFGTGNYNDQLMEQLADAGNGNYSYIDSLLEAQKVLVTERGSTLETIAKDVKIQIEFNPTVVTEYRLIGYENRALNREDFNNDQIDAGEIGAGHTVTALYEIALAGEGGESIDPLRYQNETASEYTGDEDEIAFLKMRFKYPDEDSSNLREFPIETSEVESNVRNTSDNFRFSAAVAALGQNLRGGTYLKDFSYDEIKDLANSARGDDEYGYRAEMIQLIDLADSLSR